MCKNEKITPKKDVIFKRLFGSVGSEKILKSLLEAILEIKIESVELNLDKELERRSIQGKRNILDILAKLKDGTLINVEMQLEVPKDLEKRNLDYWSDLYTSQLKKGKKYEVLKKTIGIWILDEDFFKDLPEYHNKFVIKEDKTNNCEYFKDFELHFLELNKLRKGAILKPKKLDFWMWFIDYTNKEMVEMAYRSEEEIRAAVDKLRELSADEEISRIMFLEDIYEMDQISLREKREEEAAKREAELKEEAAKREAELKEEAAKKEAKIKEEAAKKEAELKEEAAKKEAEALEKGMQKGMQKMKETAKRLKEMGLTKEQIAKATELSLEEIENLN